MHNFLDQLIEKRANYLTKAEIKTVDNTGNNTIVDILIPKGNEVYHKGLNYIIPYILGKLKDIGKYRGIESSNEGIVLSFESNQETDYGKLLETLKEYVDKINHPDNLNLGDYNYIDNNSIGLKDSKSENENNKIESDSLGNHLSSINKEVNMQVNSNIILINKEAEEFKEIETILTKIATENGIEDVGSINISFDQEEGIISFKKANIDYLVDDKTLETMGPDKLRNYLDYLNREIEKQKIKGITPTQLNEIKEKVEISLNTKGDQNPQTAFDAGHFNISETPAEKSFDTSSLSGLNIPGKVEPNIPSLREPKLNLNIPKKDEVRLNG